MGLEVYGGWLCRVFFFFFEASACLHVYIQYTNYLIWLAVWVQSEFEQVQQGSTEGPPVPNREPHTTWTVRNRTARRPNHGSVRGSEPVTSGSEPNSGNNSLGRRGGLMLMMEEANNT
jgi:hypothetical protein